MYADGIWLKDEDGRARILRGVNLGGSSKLPHHPDGATYRSEGFFDHRDVSFVGRPFPLNEADEHLRRLRAWGMTFIRFLVTWEAVEHAGPGKYDEAYLDYLHAVVKKAAEHGIEMFIDPHQDVWSRWTGGDGAPGWTLEAVGMDLTKLHATGAAFTHQMHGDPLPRMTWFANHNRFGAATMFALFFAGNDVAPETRIDGIGVQDYLQNHFIESMRQVALKLADLPNVVGYDTLNEPKSAWLGWQDIGALPADDLMRRGVTLTPLQAMAAAAGHTITAPVYEIGMAGPEVIGEEVVNPDGVRLWRDGFPDLWQANGVWTDEGGTPRALRAGHFAQRDGRSVDFNRDYLKPFIARFADAMRSVDPGAVLFVEAPPAEQPLDWTTNDPPNVVNANHWYDYMTLLTKQFNPEGTLDLDTREFVFGADQVGATFARAIGKIKRESIEHMGGVPTLIGEFGLPFDLDDKAAYTTGDFSMHVRALDMYYDAMDKHLVSCTIWTYTADNTNARGDQWNDEDLSIYSRDQRANPDDIHSGGRALEAVVRPYAMRIAGEPLRMSFELETCVFEFEYRHDPAIHAPTEIFVPEYQYPDGVEVEISDGRYAYDRDAQMVLVWHIADTATHTVRIAPAPLPASVIDDGVIDVDTET